MASHSKISWCGAGRRYKANERYNKPLSTTHAIMKRKTYFLKDIRQTKTGQIGQKDLQREEQQQIGLSEELRLKPSFCYFSHRRFYLYILLYLLQQAQSEVLSVLKDLPEFYPFIFKSAPDKQNTGTSSLGEWQDEERQV